MKCPIDLKPLAINSKENIVGHCCNECYGIFLTHQYAQAFQYNFETCVINTLYQQSFSHHMDVLCPACQTPMLEACLDGAPIGLCSRCKGLWFQEGEIERIISIHSPCFKEKSSPWFSWFFWF